MICKPCRHGANMNSIGDWEKSRTWHELCEGCFCQHETGNGWVSV